MGAVVSAVVHAPSARHWFTNVRHCGSFSKTDALPITIINALLRVTATLNLFESFKKPICWLWAFCLFDLTVEIMEMWFSSP